MESHSMASSSFTFIVDTSDEEDHDKMIENEDFVPCTPGQEESERDNGPPPLEMFIGEVTRLGELLKTPKYLDQGLSMEICWDDGRIPERMKVFGKQAPWSRVKPQECDLYQGQKVNFCWRRIKFVETWYDEEAKVRLIGVDDAVKLAIKFSAHPGTFIGHETYKEMAINRDEVNNRVLFVVNSDWFKLCREHFGFKYYRDACRFLKGCNLCALCSNEVIYLPALITSTCNPTTKTFTIMSFRFMFRYVFCPGCKWMADVYNPTHGARFEEDWVDSYSANYLCHRVDWEYGFTLNPSEASWDRHNKNATNINSHRLMIAAENRGLHPGKDEGVPHFLSHPEFYGDDLGD